MEWFGEKNEFKTGKKQNYRYSRLSDTQFLPI